MWVLTRCKRLIFYTDLQRMLIYCTASQTMIFYEKDGERLLEFSYKNTKLCFIYYPLRWVYVSHLHTHERIKYSFVLWWVDRERDNNIVHNVRIVPAGVRARPTRRWGISNINVQVSTRPKHPLSPLSTACISQWALYNAQYAHVGRRTSRRASLGQT